MALGAMKGDELVIITKGSDEDKCIAELSNLLEFMEEEEQKEGDNPLKINDKYIVDLVIPMKNTF